MPRQVTAFRLDPDLLAGLRVVWDRDGVAPSEQVRRAIRAWLETKGALKPARKRAGTRKLLPDQEHEMISKRTVLVLGAGASHAYGFPLGSGLVDKICYEILDGQGSSLITRLENHYAASPGDAARFAEALRGSRTYSIDRFLETKGRFRDVGKAAIADVLLRAENPDTLSNAPVDQDWYRYLFSVLIHRTTEHFRDQAHRLAIITFNFDRSFERALFSALLHSYDITEEQARSLATELAVHHVHGILGEPDWLRPDHAEANPYGHAEGNSYTLGGENLDRAVAKAVPKIKVVDEEIPESVIENLQVPLRAAEFVYFLGFGFEQRNLERLGIPAILPPSCIVRGTCLGKTSQEQRQISRHIGAGPHLSEDDALTFLRTRAEALFD